MKKGFTLVELLVVVVIVGILASIALPQFETAIEKSRMSEALVNMNAIADAVQRYDQAYPGDAIASKDSIADVALQGGTWTNDTTFKTSLFVYTLSLENYDTGYVTAARIDGEGDDEENLYTLSLSYNRAARSCNRGSNTEFDSLCTFFLNM